MDSDIADMRQKINNLRKINLDHEQTLKCFGISINELPNQINNEMQQLFEVKRNTGLVDIDITYLTEWYANAMEEQFPKKLAVWNLKKDISNIEEDLNENTTKLKQAQSFIEMSLKNTKSDLEMQQLFEEKKRDLEQLAERKKNIPSLQKDLDIDEVVRKSELIGKKN